MIFSNLTMKSTGTVIMNLSKQLVGFGANHDPKIGDIVEFDETRGAIMREVSKEEYVNWSFENYPSFDASSLENYKFFEVKYD